MEMKNNRDSMKRLFVFVFAGLLALSSCKADGKKQVVALKDIPVEGQRILNTCFSDSKVSVVLKETEIFEVEYEVRFEDGSEVVFDADGAWKKIDCGKSAVPEALVPVEILENVRITFPGAAIVEIEKDRRGYDAELNNGLELSFDRKYRMRIDD